MPHPRRRFAVLIPATIAFLLAGCAAPSPTQETSPPSAPTPVLETKAPSAPTTVTHVFDGDCDAAFPSALVIETWGEDARLSNASVALAGVAAVEERGGLVCNWNSTDLAGSANLVVLPTSSVPAEELGDPYCYGACRFSTVTAGLWLSGVVMMPDSDEDSARAAIRALTDSFSSTAPAQPAVTPPASGSWGPVADCDEFLATADMLAVLDQSSGDGFTGNGPAEVAPGLYTATRAVGTSSCMWQGDEGGFGFAMTAVPGAAWVEPDLRAERTVEETTVTGAESAFFLSGPGGTSGELEIFADGNWMRIQPNVRDSSDARALAVRVAEALIPAMPAA